MTLARLRRIACLAGVSLGLGAAYACSLNPQPLPPGETADSGKMGPGTDAGAQLGSGDAGGFGDTDATTGSAPDAGGDAPSENPTEGGEADGAEGGETDAPSDGPADATDATPSDAPSDGEGEGGG